MADMALYTAVYESVPPALADLDAIEELHEDAMVGKFRRGRHRPGGG
jgi:hypothetical protein